MKFFKNKLPQPSEFIRNVLKLGSSSALASVITAATLPVITRLFSTADWGLYQVFYATILPIGMIASLKYEMAIVLPKDERESNHLSVISMLVLGIFTVVLAGVLWLFGDDFLRFIKAEQLAPYRNYIVLGVLLTGLLQVCRSLLIRYKMFNDLAGNRVYQSAVTQGVAIVWGAIKPGFVGLMVSYLLGQLVPVWLVLRKRLLTFKNFDVQIARKLAAEYQKFPIVNTPSVFLNNFSLQLPVYMIAIFFDEAVVGLYGIANQALVMPTITLIGTSFQQVYYQAASEAYQKDAQSLMKVYQKTIKRLSVLGLAPILAIMFLAPILAGFVFGEQWADAGVYMQILCIGVYFRLINSPIGATLSIINRQEVGLVLIILSVIVRGAAMYFFRDTAIEMLWALTISTAVFYAAYNFSVYYYIRKEM